MRTRGVLAQAKTERKVGAAWKCSSVVTLAIETSCDDTCVAILEKHPTISAARLLFSHRISLDNRLFGGVHPATAVVHHSLHLANLVHESLQYLPVAKDGEDQAMEVKAESSIRALSAECPEWMHSPSEDTRPDTKPRVRKRVRKPDLVAVTRGPGMTQNLAVGLNTAKGLSVAWDVPLVPIHHMQAHALTPRLASALERWRAEEHDSPGFGTAWSSARPTTPAAADHKPAFPFLTLLVSGGHTLLLSSSSLTAHDILAEADSIAVGDMLDKCAREILPPRGWEHESFGAQLERFAFPPTVSNQDMDYDYSPPATRADEIKPLVFMDGAWQRAKVPKTRGAQKEARRQSPWWLTPPLAEQRGETRFEFAGLSGQVQKLAAGLEAPGIRLLATADEASTASRRHLARAAMQLAFEHLASRVVMALQHRSPDTRLPNTLVLSGGVASNMFLRHVLTSVLAARGFPEIQLIAPPPSLCTDNAAMIAWCAVEMWEEGLLRHDLRVLPNKKWRMEKGGVLDGICGDEVAKDLGF